MSRRTDEEFDAIIHDAVEAEHTPEHMPEHTPEHTPEHAPEAESDEVKHLREELVPAHAVQLDDAS
ncbi:MAG TPA: hypothetical protein VHZ98_05125 [Galbitalea sp.]|jgi:hypothetical protein|nr:hypothetical protein [Galbitalea sp.]